MLIVPTPKEKKNLRIGTYSRIGVGGHLSVDQKTNRPHRKRDDFGFGPYAVNDQAFNWLMRLARSACPRLSANLRSTNNTVWVKLIKFKIVIRDDVISLSFD